MGGWFGDWNVGNGGGNGRNFCCYLGVGECRWWGIDFWFCLWLLWFCGDIGWWVVGVFEYVEWFYD